LENLSIWCHLIYHMNKSERCCCQSWILIESFTKPKACSDNSRTNGKKGFFYVSRGPMLHNHIFLRRFCPLYQNSPRVQFKLNSFKRGTHKQLTYVHMYT
jgi:hypothetical protein